MASTTTTSTSQRQQLLSEVCAIGTVLEDFVKHNVDLATLKGLTTFFEIINSAMDKLEEKRTTKNGSQIGGGQELPTSTDKPSVDIRIKMEEDPIENLEMSGGQIRETVKYFLQEVESQLDKHWNKLDIQEDESTSLKSFLCGVRKTLEKILNEIIWHKGLISQQKTMPEECKDLQGSVHPQVSQYPVFLQTSQDPVCTQTLQDSVYPQTPQGSVWRQIPQDQICLQIPQDPVCPQTLQDPVCPQTLQDPVCPQTLQDPVCPQTLQDPVCPQTLQDPLCPQTLQDPECPQTSQDSVCPQTPQDPEDPQTSSATDSSFDEVSPSSMRYMFGSYSFESKVELPPASPFRKPCSPERSSDKELNKESQTSPDKEIEENGQAKQEAD